MSASDVTSAMVINKIYVAVIIFLQVYFILPFLLSMVMYDRRVAEVFERVFILTGIFIKGGGGLLGGSGGMSPQNILKSRGSEMLFSA